MFIYRILKEQTNPNLTEYNNILTNLKEDLDSINVEHSAIMNWQSKFYSLSVVLYFIAETFLTACDRGWKTCRSTSYEHEFFIHNNRQALYKVLSFPSSEYKMSPRHASYKTNMLLHPTIIRNLKNRITYKLPNKINELITKFQRFERESLNRKNCIVFNQDASGVWDIFTYVQGHTIFLTHRQ